MATNFTPVTFTRGTETQVAYSLSEYMNLLWDGWLPGTPVEIPPEQVRAHLSDLAALEARINGSTVALEDLEDPGSVVRQRIEMAVLVAVGQNSTVTTAAAAAATAAATTAVAAKVAEVGVVKGADSLPAAYPGVAFAITDKSGRRSWLEVATGTGGPTDHAAAFITTLVKAIPAVPISTLQGAGVEKIASTSGYVFVVTDRNGRIGFAVRTDGTIVGTIDKAKALAVSATPAPFELNSVFLETLGSSPSRTIRYSDSTTGKVGTISGGDNYDARVMRDPADQTKGVIAYTNTTGSTTTRLYRRIADGATFPAVSSQTTWAQWGDSLTNRGGIVNALAAKMPGTTVAELGAEGQTSDEIVARQGGVNAVTTAAFTIPASGGAVVPLSIAVGYNDQNNNDGTLAGVPGVMTADASRVSTFTRTTAGSAVVVPVGTAWVSAKATTYESASVVFFVGRNDVSQSKGAEIIVPNVKAAVARLRPLFKRFLVLGVTTSTNETTGTNGYNKIVDTNTQLAALYGARFVDIRRYLIDNAAALIAAQGLTKTAADDTAIAGDTIPPSLMGAGDPIHFNAATQTAIGNYVFDAAIQPLGWNS